MNSRVVTVGVFVAALVGCSSRPPQPLPLAVSLSPKHRARLEASGSRFAVATQGEAATLAAQRAYEAGGNVIDAAIAASFAISVERPHSTGIGGGGFLIYREAATGRVFAVDFRERAPARASQDMFLDKQGAIIPGLSINGILAAGTPGLVAGLLEAHERFGRLPRESVIETAIETAERGFAVYPSLARALADRQAVLRAHPESARIFLRADGSPLAEGDFIVQKDLAKTLRLIARHGRRGFYGGTVAQAIERESKRLGGLIDRRDLSAYLVKWRQPVRGSFKGYEIVSMPPPSSGGTHVIQILNILEGDDLKSHGPAAASTLHLAASAMQQAFADRAAYMGDPDFARDIPLAGLTSKSYGRELRARISGTRARRADEVRPGEPRTHPRPESSETTHLTVMDSEGNVVVTTQTINGWMGSGVVVPGTGVLLNNEMDDFSAKIGAQNLFGAVGGEPNAISPGKTPLSSMSPTVVFKDGLPVLALGAPGGTRIITCVAQTILNRLEHEMPLYESIASLRFHHQWRPDRLELEAPGPGPEVEGRLRNMGHYVKVGEIGCRVNAVAREGAVLRAVADPRDLGSSFAR